MLIYLVNSRSYKEPGSWLSFSQKPHYWFLSLATIIQFTNSLFRSSPPTDLLNISPIYGGADKSLDRLRMEETQKHIREARDFNNIETRAFIKFFYFLQGKAPKEIHAILTEILECFLPGRAKYLSAPLYKSVHPPLW